MCCDGASVGPVVLVLRKSLYFVLAVSALDTLVSNPIGNWDLLLVMGRLHPELAKEVCFDEVVARHSHVSALTCRNWFYTFSSLIDSRMT